MNYFSPVLFFAVIFVILVLFLRKIFNKDITGATAHLEELTSEYSKKEEEIKKLYEESKQQSQELLINAKNESEQLRQSILKEAHDEREKIINDGHSKADDIIQKAERSRQALIAEIERKIEERAALRAVKLMQEVLPEAVRKDIHDRWFNEFIDSIFERTERLHIPGEIFEAKIVTAFSLAPLQRQALAEKIKEKLGRQMDLKEEIEPGIIAGLIVNVGSLVFDGSLRLKIEEAALVKS